MVVEREKIVDRVFIGCQVEQACVQIALNPVKVAVL
jgi:hypothetical protein